jgi:hypothetical protein
MNGMFLFFSFRKILVKIPVFTVKKVRVFLLALLLLLLHDPQQWSLIVAPYLSFH